MTQVSRDLLTIERQMPKVILFVLFTVLSIRSYSMADFHSIVTCNVGMSTVSITENESTIEQTDDSVESSNSSSAEASSISAMNFQLGLEFAHDGNMAYIAKAFAPLMSSGGSGLFGTEIGFNMYLNDLGTKLTMNNNGTSVTIVPSFKYYWGAVIGGGYLVYSTESATKSDVYFDLGVHAGMTYSFGDNWGVNLEAGFARTTGVATTGTKMDIVFGASYYL